MNSLIKDTPLKSLIKRNIPPLYKDLLLWTNREYDPTTHQIKSRISPAYNLTLKQGLVAKTGGAGTDKVTFTGFQLTKATSFELSIDIHNMGAPATGIQTLWASNASNGTYCGIQTTDQYFTFFDGNFPAGNLSMKLSAGFLSTGGNYNFKLTKPADSNTVTLTVRNLATGATSSNAQTTAADFNTLTWNCLGARQSDRPLRSGFSNEKITINGVCVANRPYNGSTKDICTLGSHGTISGTVSLAEHSDYSTFRNDEYGFAVKSGAIYPKLLDGTGYAGLVGAPDATYQGLIALQGGIEVAGQALLGTLFDFTHTPNTEIENAGISWDEWDGEDTNEDTVGTAETDLDTDYYNAITASLMTNTSIAGYAGTSNVSKRLFFKVADRVMKDDGSFLAESGKVQEIMVYKRDLTEAEILRVQKYCREVTE